jgi:hypothetical protein
MLARESGGFSVDAFRPDHALTSPSACLVSASGNTFCGIAPGRPLRWSGSPSGVVQMAASLKSATCSPDTRRPTGSARGAGGSPRGRAPTASSNSRRVTSWTGWPISCRHRGSIGTACRLETSQGCSPRITSSGPPSRPSQSGMSARGAMPRLMGMRSADMRWAEIPTATAATHATDRVPTTPRGKAWAKLMARVGEEFPLECPGCGGDTRLIALHPSRGRSGRS